MFFQPLYVIGIFALLSIFGRAHARVFNLHILDFALNQGWR